MQKSTNSDKIQMQNTRARASTRSEDGWYKRRTHAEKVLLIALFFVVIVSAVLSIMLAASMGGFMGNNNDSWNSKILSVGPTFSSEGYNICLNEGCVKAASSIIDRINPEVNPCEDFHEFACGKYESSLVIPDEKTAVTEFNLISDDLQERLRLIINKPILKTDSMSTILVKNLYKSCMDVETIEKKGLDPLKNILANHGGWPVVEGNRWNENAFSWTNVVYTNRQIGLSVDHLFDFSVIVDATNSSWRIIDLDQPGLGMPSRKHLLKGLNDSLVKAYLEYQISLATLLGAPKLTVEEELKKSLEFEIQIATISKDSEQRRNMSQLYNKMSLADLQRKAPNIQWVEYVNKLLPKHIQVNEKESIIISDTEYFIRLNNLLKITPKRVVANYMLWRVVSSTIGFLSDKPRDIQLKYSKTLTGKGTRASRWKECMSVVSGSLSHAVGALYAKKFFKENAKNEAVEMVSYIRKAFHNMLKSVDWMDPVTLSRALIKSEKITSHIAYPKELLEDNKINELYQNLTITEGNFLENERTLTIFWTDYGFGKLREKVDKGNWKNYGAAAIVNAFYSQVENSIEFPAGILQGIFFDADRPKYLNYGAIGVVIGHEITHGFDDRGRQFDGNGDLFNWWDGATQEKFNRKAQCMIWQYGNFTVPEVNLTINGINTQGENIADNGGLKQAYHAYQDWIADNGKEDLLPGLAYTPNQLFWISAAHVWCGKFRPETLRLRVITGFHSPLPSRINGPMKNNKDFSADWQCPIGSKMNPIHRCDVW